MHGSGEKRNGWVEGRARGARQEVSAGGGRRIGEGGGEGRVRVCLNTEGVQSGVFAGARASERARRATGSKDKRGWGGWPADSALI